jgi:hypothetical protein
MERFGRLALGVIGVAMLASCSGGGGNSTGTLPGQSVAAGGGVGDTSSAPSGETGAMPTDTGSGSCHVTVTGDVTADWTSGGGASAVGYGPWVANPGVTTIIGALDESFFVVNCEGPGDNYVGFLTTTDSKIPMEPATYAIAADASALSGEGGGKIAPLISLDGTDSNWSLATQGEFVITAFDDQHIAGTFSLPMTDAFADLNGTSKGDALITGVFDYANPN